ncbi:MAG TPA: Spy/CpxP family protein refolding chaperone [Candidatus Sulfotelmatobacter sp.]|nr:Spy/CpxP family protein refolding chaperone [Candidatus Sulfotelmatobacter sp.]
MKSIRFRLLVAALAIVFGSAIARSQSTTDAPPPPPMHGHRLGMEGHNMAFFAKQLNLTDEQQAQMKTIMESAHTSMKPLHQQSRQIDQQLRQYAMGTYEDAPVQKLAQQKALIDAQLTVAQTKVHNQMFQLLTPDQQAKAKQLVANHEAHMQQHMHQAPPPTAEQ